MARVIAFTMHEHEQATAGQIIASPIVTDGYTAGDADDAQIAQLEAAGLVVQTIDDAPPEVLALEKLGFEPTPLPAYYLVWLRLPLAPDFHRMIDDTQTRLLEKHKEWFLFYVENDAQLEALSALPFARSVRPYTEMDTAEALLRANILTAHWDLILHPFSDRVALDQWLLDKSIQVTSTSERKIRIEASKDIAIEAARRVEIAQVLPFRAPELRLDRARVLVGAHSLPVAPANSTLTGNGVVVGVADTGIDGAHAAFIGAPLKLIARGRPDDGSDPHGHGTHVTGSIGGRPSGGTAHLGGIAPAVQLVVQSVLDASGGLGGLGDDLTDLFSEAYRHEVRIHNNSWGADVGGAYTTSSLEIDRFVWEHPDMLVVIAAGNAGTCLDPENGMRKTDAGCVDWYSVGAPGTSKNALVVGASRSDRVVGGWSQLRHRDVWPARFPNNPIGDELISGDPESIAGFSSRGLSDDNRLKPDIVAPGTDLAAPRASTAPSFNFAGMVPGTQRQFGYMSGTSMATPVVSGIAALVREYLQRDRNVARPSAALMKAILINGARPLEGAYARSDAQLEGVPNPHQGFGCVDLARSIPLDGSMVLAFVDSWAQPASGFTRRGANRRRFTFKTTARAPLRITLAYTDYWARGVQNNLDLAIERPQPTSKRLLGNQNLAKIGKLPDSTNNVESVKLDDSEIGAWVISVVATTILHDDQHFGLVVTGALAADNLTEMF